MGSAGPAFRPDVQNLARPRSGQRSGGAAWAGASGREACSAPAGGSRHRSGRLARSQPTRSSGIQFTVGKRTDTDSLHFSLQRRDRCLLKDCG